MARLRAVEQRRYLVRASTSGPSAIVDPLGRVHARTVMFTRAVMTGEAAPMTLRTIYADIGDAFAYACVALTVCSMLARARRR